MSDVVVILTTVASDEEGQTIARALLDERLAACVNVLAPMMSVYRWKGVVQREVERLLVIKTTRDRAAAVQARIGELHSYDLPECLVLPVVDGRADYLDWVRQSVSR